MNWARPDTGCPNQNHDRVKPDCKNCRIVELLRTYNDVLTTIQSPSNQAAGATRAPTLLPPAYHQGSYRHLELAIKLMLATHPKQTRHMLARYRDCDHKRMNLVVEIQTPHGRKKEPREHLVETWPGWVRMEKVRRAIKATGDLMPAAELPGDIRARWDKPAARNAA